MGNHFCKCKKVKKGWKKQKKRMKHWQSAPGCAENHEFIYSTEMPDLNENDAYFKCQLCSQTMAAKEGRYHCEQCNFDVCKPCFEAPEPEPEPEPANPGDQAGVEYAKVSNKAPA